MRKAILHALSNFRKNKAQTIILLIVLIISVIFVQIGVTLTLDYSKNFDKRAAITNTEDVMFSFQTRDETAKANWESIIKSDSRTKQLEITESLCNNISANYGSGKTDSHTVILPVNSERDLGRCNFVERTQIEGEVIYLPYLFKTGGGYKTGDNFSFNIKANEYNFTIGGFYENAMMGSFNGTMMSYLLSDDAYNRLDNENDIQGYLFSVKLFNRADNDNYHSVISSKINESAHSITHNSTYYSLVKSSRTLTANICSMIFLCVAILILVISLIIIVFRISNNIDEEMKTYGAMQAIGYTGKQIIGFILLQYLLIGIVSAIVGIGLSFAVLPVVNQLLVMQTGIVWAYKFNILTTLLPFLLLLLIISGAALLSASKIRRLQPIKALRQGVETHNFKRNVIPLNTGKGNLNFLLGLKSACRNMKQNTAMILIITVISFLCVYMGVLYNSFVIDSNVIMDIMAGEQSDAAVFTSAEDAEEIYSSIKERPEVNRIYRYQTSQADFNGEQIMMYVVDKIEDLNSPGMCYSGRLPKHDNEIALGGLTAKKNNVKLGDYITLSTGSAEEKYLVSGFIQNANYLGKDCVMLTDGYKKLNSSPLNGEYYILLQKGQDIDNFLASITADFGAKLISVVNIRDVIDGGFGVYASIVSLLVVFLLLIFLGIIALILFLMVKTYQIKKQHDYGIMKALGYTYRDLVLQTITGFLPVIFLGAILGIIIGVFSVNPLFSLLFSGIGIIKAMFPISAGIVILFVATVVIVALLMAFLVSGRIRKISPIQLLTHE